MPLKTAQDKNSDIIKDLGFGSKVMRESALRLLATFSSAYKL